MFKIPGATSKANDLRSSANSASTPSSSRDASSRVSLAASTNLGSSPLGLAIPLAGSATNASIPPSPSSATDNLVEKSENTTGSRLLVGPDVKLKGAEILDCDTLVVEGSVEATMDSHIIRIAENGTFSGTVSVDTAEIFGNFEGELTARSRLIVHATGRVNGKIRYGKIVIEDGGQVCGDIQSTTAAVSPVIARQELDNFSKAPMVSARA